MNLNNYTDLSMLPENIGDQLIEQEPWAIAENLPTIIESLLSSLGDSYAIKGNVAIHNTAKVHKTAIIDGPVIIGPGSSVGPHACLRSGVILGENVVIGSSCEIKSSIVCNNTAVAHLNYIGNSIVGNGVNIEAGAVIANHFNEREDKSISVLVDGEKILTGAKKFGALVGDLSRIGANAVTTPGTILPKRSIVNRLELVDQLKD